MSTNKSHNQDSQADKQRGDLHDFSTTFAVRILETLSIIIPLQIKWHAIFLLGLLLLLALLYLFVA